MPLMPPINLQRWVEEHRELLKPPVGNKMIWQDADFLIMAVGGPNQRKDFHVEDGEEFFYQVEGDITVRVIEDGKVKEIPVRQGEMFLLPAGVPHSPQRPANTVGLVIERRRREGERDHLRWYCEQCGHELYDADFKLVDLGRQVKEAIQDFYGDERKRTCRNCGAVAPAPAPAPAAAQASTPSRS